VRAGGFGSIRVRQRRRRDRSGFFFHGCDSRSLSLSAATTRQFFATAPFCHTQLDLDDVDFYNAAAHFVGQLPPVALAPSLCSLGNGPQFPSNSRHTLVQDCFPESLLISTKSGYSDETFPTNAALRATSRPVTPTTWLNLDDSTSNSTVKMRTDLYDSYESRSANDSPIITAKIDLTKCDQGVCMYAMHRPPEDISAWLMKMPWYPTRPPKLGRFQSSNSQVWATLLPPTNISVGTW
jgi:hypothetical protein